MTSFFHENSIYSLLLQQQKNLLKIHDGNYGALKNMAPNVPSVNDVAVATAEAMWRSPERSGALTEC